MTSPARRTCEADQTDDMRLLRAYVESGSEQAFARLVERHIAMVHSAALRQCRHDRDAAHDVTQVVFMLLAKKAPRIGPGSLLSGWLVRATHFAARSQRRAESRRKRHEAHAASLRERENAMKMRDRAAPHTDPDLISGLWERVWPLLDEVLARLPAAARDILVLRFLEGKTYADVGKRLGITEGAARKRAQRGLLSLRAALARRGIHACGDVLEAALQAAVAAPVPAAITRAVAAGVGSTHHHTLMLKGALKLMALSKAKTAAVAVVAALLVGGGGMVVSQLARPSGSVRVVPLPDNASATICQRDGTLQVVPVPPGADHLAVNVTSPRLPAGFAEPNVQVQAVYEGHPYTQVDVGTLQWKLDAEAKKLASQTRPD